MTIMLALKVSRPFIVPPVADRAAPAVSDPAGDEWR
jgi:hypothetical protein